MAQFIQSILKPGVYVLSGIDRKEIDYQCASFRLSGILLL